MIYRESVIDLIQYLFVFLIIVVVCHVQPTWTCKKPKIALHCCVCQTCAYLLTYYHITNKECCILSQTLQINTNIQPEEVIRHHRNKDLSLTSAWRLLTYLFPQRVVVYLNVTVYSKIFDFWWILPHIPCSYFLIRQYVHNFIPYT